MKHSQEVRTRTRARLDDNVKRSRTLSAIIGLPIAIVLSVVALLIGVGIVGVIVAVVVALAVVTVISTKSEMLALKRLDAAVADPVAYPQYHNLVEGLCVTAGLAKPALYVVDDPSPNACAVGRDASHASLVVTSGLLDVLSRIELEGVLAHELSHIRDGDVIPATLAVIVVAPFSPKSLESLLPPHREELADLSGVALTRYPPGLIDALEKIAAGGDQPTRAHPTTRHLWLAEPEPIVATDTRSTAEEPRLSSRVALSQRIARLREL